MKNIYILVLFILLLVGGLISQYYLRKESNDLAWHAIASVHLERLLVIDGHINESIVKTRYNLENNYDNLAANVRAFSDEIKALVKHMHARPEISLAVQEDIDRLRDAYENKKDVTENFKSHNSVLKNSVLYAPTVGSELIKISSQVPEGEQFSQYLSELNTNVLKYSHSTFEEHPEVVTTQFNELNTQDQSLPVIASIAYSEFSNHVQTVLDEKPFVEQYLATALLMPIADQVFGVKSHLDGMMLKAAETGQQVNYFTIAYFSVFALSVLLLGLRFSRANGSIATAVESRTRDIEAEYLKLKEASENSDADSQLSASDMHAIHAMDTMVGNVSRNIGSLQFRVIEMDRFFAWVKKLSDTFNHENVDKAKANELIKKVVIYYRDLARRKVFDEVHEVLKDSEQGLQDVKEQSAGLIKREVN